MTSTIPSLNRSQRRVFDDLLAMGGSRPVMPDGLVDRLSQHLVAGISDATAQWTGSRLFVSKSLVTNTLRCEGLVLANESSPLTTLAAPTAVGIAAHRAVQIAYTHEQLTAEECVNEAIAASCGEDRFAEFWETAGVGTQSDLTMQILSKTIAFLDSFPPLMPNWSARFEEGFQAPLGPALLGARCDLVLGRPKADQRQTMFLADLKTGSLNDGHFHEAMFYALVSTLHFGVAPYRSAVYSLASLEWTDPDVTEPRLFEAADQVIETVQRYVGAKSGRRPVQLSPGPHCRYCPDKGECESFDPDAEPVSRPVAPVAVVSTPVAVGDASAVTGGSSDSGGSIFDIVD